MTVSFGSFPSDRVWIAYHLGMPTILLLVASVVDERHVAALHRSQSFRAKAFATPIHTARFCALKSANEYVLGSVCQQPVVRHGLSPRSYFTRPRRISSRSGDGHGRLFLPALIARSEDQRRPLLSTSTWILFALLESAGKDLSERASRILFWMTRLSGRALKNRIVTLARNHLFRRVANLKRHALVSEPLLDTPRAGFHNPLDVLLRQLMK